MQYNYENGIKYPLGGVLFRIGFALHNTNYFQSDALFWSLVRLFTSYDRIMRPLHFGLPVVRNFMDSDIEQFIIRHRILLDDIAYIIRRALPNQHKGLKGPKGLKHPADKNVSINNLLTFIEKNPSDFPQLTAFISKYRKRILLMREMRDDISHYRAKVLYLETDPLSFAVFRASGTETTEIANDGGRKIVTTPIKKFVHKETEFIWRLLNEDLKAWLEEIYSNEMDSTEAAMGNGGATIDALGIELFTQISNQSSKQIH